MRRIYCHCGLHKTGTTALQSALFKNKDQLKKNNITYFVTGIPKRHTAHHNIAWELCNDRRFRGSHGTFSALISESRSCNGDGIISSEDFESLLIESSFVTHLKRLSAEADCDVSVVCYFRSVDDYLVSIFLQLLKSGRSMTFLSTFKEVLDVGQISHNEQKFYFDYKKIIENFNGSGIELIGRSYDQLTKSSVVDDFFECIGIEENTLNLSEFSNVNKRSDLRKNVFLFLKNRNYLNILNRKKIQYAIALMCDTGDQPLALSTYFAELVREKFKNSQSVIADLNSAACRTRVKEETNPSIGILKRKKIDIAKVFSEETEVIVFRLKERISILDILFKNPL
jgi:hypothetical protein